MKVCGTCAHWKRWPGEDDGAPGVMRYVPLGTCALGGPPPREGGSDCHRDETCEDHKEKDQK